MNMSILNLNEFCKISAGTTVFRWKKAAVNLNSQEKFYNGASAVLRRLAAVSAEVEKERRISKKSDPGSIMKSQIPLRGFLLNIFSNV